MPSLEEDLQSLRDLPNEGEDVQTSLDVLRQLPTQSVESNPTFMGMTGQEWYGASETPTAVAGSLAGELLTGGNPLGGGAGAAGASYARKVVGNLLGYEPKGGAISSLEDVPMDFVIGVAGSSAGTLASKGLTKGAQALYGKPATTEAADASIRTGIQLTPGQASGRIPIIEGILARTPFLRGTYDRFHAEQMQQSARALDDVLSTIKPDAPARETIGSTIKKTYGDIVDNLFKARSAAGRSDFALVDSSLGGMRYIETKNAISVLKEEATRLGGVGAPPSDALKARQLIAVAEDIEKNGGRLTGTELQQRLFRYGSGAFGKGDSLWSGLEMSASDKAMSTRIYNAFAKDLDEAANTPGISGTIAQSLQNARAGWADTTKTLQELRDATISKVLEGKGKGGEDVYKALGSFDSTELKATSKLFDAVDPTIMQNYKRRYMEDALSSVVDAQGNYSARALKKVLDTNKDKLDVLLPNSSARNQLNYILEQLVRIEHNKPGISYGITGMGMTIGTATYMYYEARDHPFAATTIAAALAASPAIMFNQRFRYLAVKALSTTDKLALRPTIQAITQLTVKSMKEDMKEEESVQ